MLVLSCKVIIESKDSKKRVTFDHVNAIEVKTSVKNFTDTATVKIPRRTSWQGEPITDFIQRGDSIQIDLGYQDVSNQTVFKGYITNIENGFPIVLSCENEMYRLKKITVAAEKMPKFDFKTWFKKYEKDVEVVYVGDVKFGSMDIQNEMPFSRAIEEIMKIYTFFNGFFQDGKFYVIMISTPFNDRKPIVFSPQRNMISDSLSYSLAEDLKICIKAVTILEDNKRLEVIVPEDAKKNQSKYELRTFFSPESKTETQLKEFAQKKLKEFSQDKMTGSFTTFGIPFVRKADNIIIKDNYRKERDNKRFFVDGVTYNFSTSGYRQTITLGYQITYNG